MACPRPSPRNEPGTRLHKFLASAGCGSRRACERLIEAGRVSVDGATVREQGVRIEPGRQAVQLDGRPVKAPQARVTLLFNKPRDALCTARDPRGRRTVFDLLPPLPQRVFTVGRLDRNSEGLLLVTNDGALAQALAHPRYGVEKRYRAWTAAPLSPESQARLRRGVLSQGEHLTLRGLEPSRRDGVRWRCEIRLGEGRNRHIRRMFEALGIPILRLQRVALGPLELGSLRAGAWRPLLEIERRALQEAVRPPPERTAANPARRPDAGTP